MRISSDFNIRIPGKWVLAGEHSVLRGVSAIALPHPEFSLTFDFKAIRSAMPGDLEIFPRSAAVVIREILEQVREEALRLGHQLIEPAGVIQMDSSIPLGAGLGSSAALCSAITRWLAPDIGLETSDMVAFARGLENRFHGKSSGMDVAAVLEAVPIRFNIISGATKLGVTQIPRFTFHDSGRRARTQDCVRQVMDLVEKDPIRAAEIDSAMNESCERAAQGLIAYDLAHSEENPKKAGIGLASERALAQIAEAMVQAQACFEAWNLVIPEARLIEQRLLREGALAVKTTGAGAGGFSVALWPGAPV